MGNYGIHDAPVSVGFRFTTSRSSQLPLVAGVENLLKHRRASLATRPYPLHPRHIAISSAVFRGGYPVSVSGFQPHQTHAMICNTRQEVRLIMVGFLLSIACGWHNMKWYWFCLVIIAAQLYSTAMHLWGPSALWRKQAGIYSPISIDQWFISLIMTAIIYWIFYGLGAFAHQLYSKYHR